MRGSRIFCQRGSKVDNVFLVDEGRENPNTTLRGPPSTAIEMPFRWRFAGVPMMAQTLNAGLVVFFIFSRIRTSIAKKTYIFVIFRWRADDGQTLNAGFIAFFNLSGNPDQSGPPVPLWIRPWS